MKNPGNKKHREGQEMVVNYLIMRKSLGVLGLSLPVILIIGNLILSNSQVIMDSISEYYYTGMRNVFVGLLCCIALFLFSYKGYGYLDDLLGNIGCISAFGVAFSQCGPDVIWRQFHPVTSNFHYICAIIFFIVLIIFTFLFTRSRRKLDWKKKAHKQKIRRNIVYITCGIIMSLCLLTLLMLFIFRVQLNFKYEFWLESIVLFCFGISWLVKGEMILRDNE
jgi:hypothetical protein